jgi:hypothetical protein
MSSLSWSSLRFALSVWTYADAIGDGLFRFGDGGARVEFEFKAVAVASYEEGRVDEVSRHQTESTVRL